VSTDQNLELAKSGYEAFQRGDLEGALAPLADDIEWVVPGRSSVSGTYRGKQEVADYWAKLAEKGLELSTEYWFADDNKVVCLDHFKLDGEESDGADVLTFREGKVVKFQSAMDTAMLERIFG
jgi:ketosteroid isomerase-like protein